MSNNYVVLFVPTDVKNDGLSDYAKDLFLPFGRDYHFPSFTCPCYCSNKLEESVEYANKRTRHFHQYWRSYNTISSANRPSWTEYIKDWEAALISFRSDTIAPDKDCITCKGNGYFTSMHYPLNMYDYWYGLEVEYLGSVSELKFEWVSYEMPEERPINLLRLISPLQKPFIFYHVVTPDGLPYDRWDYSSDEAWHEAWQVLTWRWRNSYVVRCLVHE